jgi:hypothetical protein
VRKASRREEIAEDKELNRRAKDKLYPPLGTVSCF